MSIDLGGRLRFLRERHGLSQRELAKHAGVTNSTISLIESNKTNPSVGALKRILDGIPIGLAEFFALEPDRRQKVFYEARELVEIGKGNMTTKDPVDIKTSSLKIVADAMSVLENGKVLIFERRVKMNLAAGRLKGQKLPSVESPTTDAQD